MLNSLKQTGLKYILIIVSKTPNHTSLHKSLHM